VNKNPLYSISLGVASLQDDSVGVVTALSPATVGHFKFYLLSSIVGLGLRLSTRTVSTKVKFACGLDVVLERHLSTSFR
jgi:hypothetical protein